MVYRMILFCVLLILSILTYPLPDARVFGLPVAFFLSLYSALLLLWSCYRKKQKPNWRQAYPLVSLLAGFLISSVASHSWNLAFLTRLLTFYTIYFVLSNGRILLDWSGKAVVAEQFARVLLNLVIASGIVFLVYGYYGYITGHIGVEPQFDWWPIAKYWGLHYLPSTRNADIHYMIFPLIAVLVKANRRWYDNILLILFGSTVLLSMARFAWLCVAGVLVLWFLYCLRTDKNIRILLGRLALVVVALVMYVILLVAFGRVAYFFGKSTSILTTNSSALVSNSNAERSSALVSNSNAERIEIIRTTVKVIRKHPFGVGAENMHAYYAVEGLKLNHAENTYLNLLAELGFIGMLGYTALVVSPILHCMPKRRRRQLSMYEAYAFFASAYVCAALLFNTETINAYMWIMMGIISFTAHVSSDGDSDDSCKI